MWDTYQRERERERESTGGANRSASYKLGSDLWGQTDATNLTWSPKCDLSCRRRSVATTLTQPSAPSFSCLRREVPNCERTSVHNWAICMAARRSYPMPGRRSGERVCVQQAVALRRNLQDRIGSLPLLSNTNSTSDQAGLGVRGGRGELGGKRSRKLVSRRLS